MESSKIHENLFRGRYLNFTLGKEKFAMPLLQVKEVIANTETTCVPQAASYFKGIMNLRGQVISVIDLKNKLKIPKSELATESTIIILDIDGLFIGVLVDSVDSVATFTDESISDPPKHDSNTKTEYIVGVARDKNGLTLIIDLRRALNIEEIKHLANQKSA